MDLVQLLLRERPPLPFKVELLAAADALVSRGICKDPAALERASGGKRCGEHRFKGKGLQSIARERRRALAEDLVI